MQAEPLHILIARAKTGDEDAFHTLFLQFSDLLVGYVGARVKRREDALDIVQDTFLDLWQALPRFSYRSDEAFYGFIFTITKRKIARYYKTEPNTVSLEAIDMDASFEILQEDHRHLLKQLENLAEHYQELLKLRYWSGLKYREIAAIMNIKETTAKVWHHRAINELQTLIDPKKYE